ncbi:acetyl-CoA carboxylase biotin carboxylase subunit family protein [Burkholderia cenocepacia]|uniref:ATP-grasp domain-containing protein n=1 Tax=Burkholderia cenocepacia TaxID=95486 RepID=UPI000F5BB23C|nr:hypothetical protein [Burkholderia cenocepacia]
MIQNVLLLTSDKIQPIQRLATRPHLNVIPMVASRYARHFTGFDDVVLVDDIADISAVTCAFAEVLRRRPIDRIIATTDRSMPTGGWLRTHFGFPGTSMETAQYFSNKLAMKARLVEAEIPCAAFRRIGHPRQLLDSQVSWPLVVKPATASGTVDVWKLDSPQHLQHLLNGGALDVFDSATSALLAENFVEMVDEYHVDAIVRRGQIRFAVPFRYITPPLQARGSFYGAVMLDDDDPKAEALIALLGRVVSAFGLSDGVLHLEVFDTLAGLMVGEVACRPGGAGSSELMQDLLGVDIWDAFIGAHLDEPGLTATSFKRPPGVHGYFGLPGRNGLVRNLSSAEELEAIPGVRRAQIFCGLGDTLHGKKGSAVFFAGVVFFHLDDYDELPILLSEVKRRFVFDVQLF